MVISHIAGDKFYLEKNFLRDPKTLLVLVLWPLYKDRCLQKLGM